jgi:hypothetical protein
MEIFTSGETLALSLGEHEAVVLQDGQDNNLSAHQTLSRARFGQSYGER